MSRQKFLHFSSFFCVSTDVKSRSSNYRYCSSTQQQSNSNLDRTTRLAMQSSDLEASGRSDLIALSSVAVNSSPSNYHLAILFSMGCGMSKQPAESGNVNNENREHAVPICRSKSTMAQFASKQDRDSVRNGDSLSACTKFLLDPPFSTFSAFNAQLYLTGIGGITLDNLKRHRIKCLVNVAAEIPPMVFTSKQPSVLYFKYPVSGCRSLTHSLTSSVLSADHQQLQLQHSRQARHHRRPYQPGALPERRQRGHLLHRGHQSLVIHRDR